MNVKRGEEYPNEWDRVRERRGTEREICWLAPNKRQGRKRQERGGVAACGDGGGGREGRERKMQLLVLVCCGTAGGRGIRLLERWRWLVWVIDVFPISLPFSQISVMQPSLVLYLALTSTLCCSHALSLSPSQ